MPVDAPLGTAALNRPGMDKKKGIGGWRERYMHRGERLRRQQEGWKR